MSVGLCLLEMIFFVCHTFFLIKALNCCYSYMSHFLASFSFGIQYYEVNDIYSTVDPLVKNWHILYMLALHFVFHILYFLSQSFLVSPFYMHSWEDPHHHLLNVQQQQMFSLLLLFSSLPSFCCLLCWTCFLVSLLLLHAKKHPEMFLNCAEHHFQRDAVPLGLRGAVPALYSAVFYRPWICLDPPDPFLSIERLISLLAWWLNHLF